MATTRSDYPAILPQVQASQAVDILQDRVRQVGKLNTAIADWLQERRRLEEQYAQGLRRLARNKLEDADLGIFSIPWDALTESAATLADSHSALATKIEVDVERPLREFASSNRSLAAVMTMQGNLRSLAKDVDSAQQKIDRLQSKGERADSSKVADASGELDETNAQWQSQAPYVFESLQEADESRLANLRDALTQFQTHEVDLVEKNRQTAEHSLNVLLQVETADEIKTFAIKAVTSRPRQERAQRTTGGITTPARGAPTFSRDTLAPTQSTPDDESQRSESVQEDKKKNRFSAIRRMGTMVGGGRNKRESKLPETMSPMTEESEKKSKPGPFSLGRRNRSKPSVPQIDAPLEEEPLPSSSDRPSMPPQIGSEVLDAPAFSNMAPTTPMPPTRQSSLPAHANGVAANILHGSHQGDFAEVEPPRPARNDFPTQPVRDSEGYSVPSHNIDPISAAQHEAAQDGDAISHAFNVNIRDAPVVDSGAGTDDTLATIANKLGPPVISRGGTVRGRRQANRNSVATGATNLPLETQKPVPAARAVSQPREAIAAPVQPTAIKSTALPSPQQSPRQAAVSALSPISPAAQAPLFRPESRSALGTDHTGTDTQSIRSLTSTASQGTKHPELNEPGLNSSIVETVSARFDRGKITQSSLIGEIALVYNPSDFTSPFGNETIRLENFAGLEKVAPNPAFIHPSPTGKEGEYAVDLSKIARTQVAFKYQVCTTDNNETGSYAPLLLAPAFRLEANQASIIVSYSLNPAFNLHGHDSITLTHVAIGLTLDGVVASTCQSRPAGVFSRDRNLVVWQIPEITLRTGAAPEKLLARFATEGEAKGGNVEAKWEVGGEHAVVLPGLGSGLAVSLRGGGLGDVREGADPFADEGISGTAGWRGCRGVRKLVSGSYGAK